MRRGELKRPIPLSDRQNNYASYRPRSQCDRSSFLWSQRVYTPVTEKLAQPLSFTDEDRVLAGAPTRLIGILEMFLGSPLDRGGQLHFPSNLPRHTPNRRLGELQERSHRPYRESNPRFLASAACSPVVVPIKLPQLLHLYTYEKLSLHI
jgi:hypothetical protein